MITDDSHITIKDIARELNLAPSTVSMALNDHPRISTETKKRVKALAKKLQYRPNIIARAMVRKRTHLIGLIMTDIMSSFFPEIIQGIEDVVSEQFHSVILCATENNAKRERHYLQLLRQKRVDGIIAVPTLAAENRQLWEQIQEEIPMVSILRHHPENHVPYVIVNNYRGGYIATKHLIDLGHTVIAHLSGPMNIELSKERRQGFIDALEEAKLPVYPNLIKTCRFNVDDGREKTESLLNTKHLPTAIFACSDIVAIGAIQALRHHNIKVPDEMAIVGFDDLFFASFAEVPLTSVAQPKYDIGVRAAKKILKMIEGKPVTNEILEPTMVIRHSTKATEASSQKD